MTTVTIVEPDPAWPARFTAEASALRKVFGSAATRIDHVGSTSVPGLAAKDVVDIQVTLPTAAAVTAVGHPDHAAHVALVQRGYAPEPGNDDHRKAFFRLRSPGLAVNLHVRRDGCVSQQQALLLRDYLRETPDAASRYEQAKRHLAAREWASVDAYADAKSDIVWALLREADRWSWHGWQPGRTDA